MKEIQDELRRFLVNSGYLDDSASVADDESLFESGVIDSLAVMEVTQHMVTHYKMTVPPEDLIPENFDSLALMAGYISRSTSG